MVPSSNDAILSQDHTVYMATLSSRVVHFPAIASQLYFVLPSSLSWTSSPLKCSIILVHYSHPPHSQALYSRPSPSHFHPSEVEHICNNAPHDCFCPSHVTFAWPPFSPVLCPLRLRLSARNWTKKDSTRSNDMKLTIIGSAINVLRILVGTRSQNSSSERALTVSRSEQSGTEDELGEAEVLLAGWNMALFVKVILCLFHWCLEISCSLEVSGWSFIRSQLPCLSSAIRDTTNTFFPFLWVIDSCVS